jgi:hypothetical protein
MWNHFPAARPEVELQIFGVRVVHRGGRRVSQVSNESLILAQNQRWRRA